VADFDNLSREDLPGVSDVPDETQPVANPDAVAQEDEDNPLPAGLDENEDLSRSDPGTDV
jgi:hypothetical protein